MIAFVTAIYSIFIIKGFVLISRRQDIVYLANSLSNDSLVDNFIVLTDVTHFQSKLD